MPIIKDRFGEKIKTNVITNEIQEIKTWIAKKNEAEGRIYEPPPVDHTITTLHRKGQWINPNSISILKKAKHRPEYDNEWANRAQLPALDQQRVSLERLMQNPDQEIRFRTQKHAEKDLKLYTPRVFRNEGGNLMSSIAGAGCNKFHEFRQIRRNDRDREKFFSYLRDKEETENRIRAKYKAAREANLRKLTRNRKKRSREANNIQKRKTIARAHLKSAQAKKSQIKTEVMLARKRSRSGEAQETEEIDLTVEEEKEPEYDPDDSYDEDADEGLPPPELRAKIKL